MTLVRESCLKSEVFALGYGIFDSFEEWAASSDELFLWGDWIQAGGYEVRVYKAIAVGELGEDNLWRRWFFPLLWGLR